MLNGVGWPTDGDDQYDNMKGYYIGNVPGVSRLGIPSLNMQDAGQGFRTSSASMVGQVTSWSCGLGLASSWDAALVEEWASAAADEFKAKGANVILGPGLNLHRVARGGRNAEYMTGEDPLLGAALAPAYVKGFQDKGVMTVMKHFGLNNQETNRNTYSADIPDARALFEVYYPAYQAASKAGCAAAMCGYNLVNGTHACSSGQLLGADLKDTMGFGGFVMSDWWATHDTSAAQGLDMDMPGNFGEGPGDPSYFSSQALSAVDPAVGARMLRKIEREVRSMHGAQIPHVTHPSNTTYFFAGDRRHGHPHPHLHRRQRSSRKPCDLHPGHRLRLFPLRGRGDERRARKARPQDRHRVRDAPQERRRRPATRGPRSGRSRWNLRALPAAS